MEGVGFEVKGFGGRGAVVSIELACGIGGAWEMVPLRPLKASQPSSALILWFLGLITSLDSSWKPSGAERRAGDQWTLGSSNVSSINKGF